MGLERSLTYNKTSSLDDTRVSLKVFTTKVMAFEHINVWMRLFDT